MTDVALRDYLERLIQEADRRYEQRFSAADIALSKAEIALAEYKRGSNEWRDALKDMSGRMATRDELLRVDHLVQELRRDKANLDGRMMILGGGISAVVTIILWTISRIWPL